MWQWEPAPIEFSSRPNGSESERDGFLAKKTVFMWHSGILVQLGCISGPTWNTCRKLEQDPSVVSYNLPLPFGDQTQIARGCDRSPLKEHLFHGRIDPINVKTPSSYHGGKSTKREGLG